MVEDQLGTNARRRARRNASAAKRRTEPKALGDSGDRQLAIDLDYLGRTYGLDIVDFAEVDWSNGAPKLRMRGRKRV